MIWLDALGPTGVYRTRGRCTLSDVSGKPAVEMSLVPALYVQRSLSALRSGRPMPAAARVAVLTRAGQAFASGVVAGLTPQEYHYQVSRLTGLPITIVRSASEDIASAAAQAYRHALLGLPAGAVPDWQDPLTWTGNAVWLRRGDVFAVHAAGNHPGVHALWLQAVALGFRVVVRPSRREPLTPHRLVSALRAEGFGDDQVVMLPTDHAVADDIVRGADLAVVYGGDDVMRKYAGSGTVLPQGPGRSKLLLTADVNLDERIGTVVDAITAHGGTACLNATAVFVEGDPAPVAQAIADRLSALPSLPPEDDKAVLPVRPVADGRALEKYLLHQAGDAIARRRWHCR